MNQPPNEPFDINSKLAELWSERGEEVQPAQAGIQFGQKIGPYCVRAFLGAGSFGLVYLADDTETSTPVALKLPRIEVLLDKEKRKRFRVEANIVGRLNHRGIVKILRSDVDNESAMPYIACEWCTGPDLGEYLADSKEDERNQPTWEESVRLMINVCDAIHFAHTEGITHRDIKPANIILDRDLEGDESAEGLDRFTPRITDFGLARLADPVATTTRTGVVLGTPAYMAPERILAGLASGGESSSHSESVSADIYSLGAVFYELLVGKPPAKSNSWLELIREERSSSLTNSLAWNKNLPPALKNIIMTALRHHPDTRYQTAEDMAGDLRRALRGEKTHGRPIGAWKRIRMWFSAQNWSKIAGWFAVGSQAIFAVWMILADIFKIPYGLLQVQEYIRMLPMLLMIALTGSVSVLLAGVYCVKGKFWAPFVGMAFAAYNLYVPARALIGDPTVFRDIYSANDPYLSFLVHFVISIVVATQLALFGCAATEKLLRRAKR